MKVKVDIISGFLGAGKTTLIKKLIDEKLNNEKLVIIENEFGEVGIDGSILKKSNIEVREITSGCICCTLVGDFEKAIQEAVVNYRPDRIIIEPSGVGKLSDVLIACNTPALNNLITINMIITVVDALKYQIYISNFGEFYENQIKSARTIFLSRTVKADNKKVESVVRAIQKINSKANIVTTPWDKVDAGVMIAVAEGNNSAFIEDQLKNSMKVKKEENIHTDSCKCGCNHSHLKEHSANEVFDVWGIETPKKYIELEINEALEPFG